MPPSEPAELARRLLGDGIAVADDFLDDAATALLAACAQARHERGEFRPARIGADGAARRRADVRGDSICWLEEPWSDAERGLLGRLEELRLALNRAAILGLFDLELHYARYPPGAGYARHVDQPQGKGERRVTLVLYLNRAWSARAGGNLRVYSGDGTHRDIEPRGGRLVAFMTAGREHAVLAARRTRLSLTGWFRTRVS